MTTIQAPTTEPQALTRDEARTMTDQAREAALDLWLRVLALFEGRAHLALGYQTWHDYWTAEFGTSGARGDQLVRAGRVARALQESDLPLPTNDATARELVPVLQRAPDELSAVWERALDVGHGKPTGKMVREMVAPYRSTRAPRSEKRDRSTTKRRRNLVGMSLSSAAANAETAHASYDSALETEPPESMVEDWLADAERAALAVNSLVRSLRRRLNGKDESS